MGTGTVAWFGVPDRTDFVVLELAGRRLWQRPTAEAVVLPLTGAAGAELSLSAYDERGRVLAVLEGELAEIKTETETETSTVSDEPPSNSPAEEGGRTSRRRRQGLPAAAADEEG